MESKVTEISGNGSSAAEVIGQAAKEVEKETRVIKAMLVECVRLLRAGEDFLDADLSGCLKEGQSYLEREVSEAKQDNETEENIQSGEVVKDGFFRALKKDLEERLEPWRPSMQKAILTSLMAELPEKEKEDAIEDARDAARDELINTISELPYAKQTQVYSDLLLIGRPQRSV